MKSSARSSRRHFLAASSAMGVSAVLPAFHIRAGDKTGRKPPVIGTGEYTYECHHFWGRLPDGHEYGNASHGVAIDSRGLIYISHQGRPGSVFVFEPDGTFVRAMLPEHQVGKPGRERAHGHGIDVRRESDGQEYLYLSPSNPALPFTKATLEGEIIWRRGRNELERDADRKLDRYRPTNVSFGPGESVYLGDGYGSNYIFHYDREGNFRGIFGGRGTEDGRFATPHGQWLDERDGTPKTVVCDRANKRLQWFTPAGEHLRTQEGFLFPADIDIRGNLMLVPDLHARVTLLDGENRVIAHLADDVSWRNQVLDKKIGMRNRADLWRPGKFIHPHDACFDDDGNIFVAEWVVGGRVTQLRKVS